MDSSFSFDTMYKILKIVHYTYLGCQVFFFFFFFFLMYFCLNIFFFSLTNNVDPDEIPHYTAFYHQVCLHCLPKYRLGGFP